MSLYLGENLISGVATPIQGARNIGQIIQSTIPLTDAGLHLLDGAVISGDGIYSDFYNYMDELETAYDHRPNFFCSETDWQNSVLTYGVCGKFVINRTNKTIRLPKITGFIEGTTDVTALGDLLQAGLPNITATGTIGTIGSHARPTISGAFVNLRNGSVGSDEPNTTGWLYDLDASKSNAIYGNSTTVQPQSIKVLYYIVIATSTKTDIEVDIDEIATDLNDKADTDLSNCTKPHIVETYVNGTSWYRVYSDGWCEQGGGDITTSGNVNFLKPFINTNYCLVGSIGYGVNSNTWEHYDLRKESTNYFYQNCCFDGYRLVSWYACGYIS